MLRSFKPGLARLVLQAEAKSEVEVPVVAIAVRYVPDATPRAKVLIHINQPLYTRQYQQKEEKQTAQKLTEAIYSSIMEGLQALS